MTAAFAQPVCAGAPWNLPLQPGHALLPAAVSAPAAPQNPIVPQNQKFAARLAAHIASFKHYPAAGKTPQPSGTVILRFTLARDGSINDMRIFKSSGHPDLDNAAIENSQAGAAAAAAPRNNDRPRRFRASVQVCHGAVTRNAARRPPASRLSERPAPA